MVRRGYRGLEGVTGVARGFKGLEGVRGVTASFKELQVVTGGYNELPVGYKGLHGVTRG